MAVVAPKESARADADVGLPTRISSHWIFLPVALAATLGLQLTTVGYYFYFDDYVPFAEIVSQSRWDYVGHLLTSTDVTPNWRPLPGLLYLGSYEIAGMNPLPARITMIALHTASAGLLYYAVWRTTGRAWASCVGALVFGLNPAYVGALSQVTTATQVMAGFFLLATLVAVVECALATSSRRANGWLAGSVVLYVLAIGSHEGMAIMFPAFGLAFFTFDPAPDLASRLRRSAWRTAPLAAVALATAGSFLACGCNEGSEVWGTQYAGNQTLIYLGRMLYPVGLELPTEVGAAHAVAAVVLLAIMVVVSAFGEKIGRVGALWLALAVAPHVFIEYFTASRYLYVPAAGYAMVVAAVAIMIVDRQQRWEEARVQVRTQEMAEQGAQHAVPLRLGGRTAAVVAGVGIVAGLCGWYAYETVEQDEHFADATAAWRRYHDDVTRVWPEVPPGEQVVTIGGPFQKYDYQLYILPAFAETTWGPTRKLNDYEPGSLPAQLALASGSPYVGEYRDGVLVRVFDDGR